MSQVDCPDATRDEEVFAQRNSENGTSKVDCPDATRDEEVFHNMCMDGTVSRRRKSMKMQGLSSRTPDDQENTPGRSRSKEQDSTRSAGLDLI